MTNSLETATEQLISEFAKLYVSPNALEEALELKLNALTEQDLSFMQKVLSYMQHDSLTLSKAILASKRGTKIIPKAAAPKVKKTSTPKIRKTASKSSKKELSSSIASDTVTEPKVSTGRKSSKINNLLIVESPAKTKTIKKFLGPEFNIKASMGHVRDIPAKGRGSSDIGIDFDHGYQPIYAPIASREKIIKDLQSAAKKATHIYLAPDPDREGEAIAWHLKEALDLPDYKTSRVTFNAITKKAVQEAINNPTKINMALVNAQQGRRVLDRIVGYKLSPFLWKKVTKGLSAGRVQSVAVRIVAEREKEIKSFITTEFWRIKAILNNQQQDFTAELVNWQDQKFILGNEEGKQPTAPNEEIAQAIVSALSKQNYLVQNITDKEVKSRPYPPFITSTLQQAASTFLRFGAQKTMRVAQQLYEGVEIEKGMPTGLITYMRTDSTRISPEGLSEVRDYIGKNYSERYLPEKANFFSSKNTAQDAHEAIRPTSVFLTPDKLKSILTSDQLKLYELIWRRFVASQMSQAEYKTTTVKISAGEGVFEAKGRVILFDGHTILSLAKIIKKKDESEDKDEVDTKDEEDQHLPALQLGQKLSLDSLTPSQHFTQPPPRYSEASLVRALEKEGIGRPSTYAPIVQTIQDRGYVRQDKRRFYATQLGLAVTDILKENFPDILDLKFTAQMEESLDSVEEGKEDWVELVDKFYKPFSIKLKTALETGAALKGLPAPNGEKCPLCESDMTVRFSQRGAFLGCTKYPQCTGTRPLEGEESDTSSDDSPEHTEPCPSCGAPMLKKRSRFGAFLACSNYPNCKTTKPLGKDGKSISLPDIKMDCDKCGKPMQVKAGRHGTFLACSGYPECRNTKHIDKNGKVIEVPDSEDLICKNCNSPMVVRVSRRGPFLACSAYPKCRTVKPINHKD